MAVSPTNNERGPVPGIGPPDNEGYVMQAHGTDIDDKALMVAAAAVRGARNNAITPPDEGTGYDQKLARAAVTAYLAALPPREVTDLRALQVEFGEAMDIRSCLAGVIEAMPQCHLRSLLRRTLREIEALAPAPGLLPDPYASTKPTPDSGAPFAAHRLLEAVVTPAMTRMEEGDTVYELGRSDAGVTISKFPERAAAESVMVPAAALHPLRPVPAASEDELEEARAYLDDHDTDGEDTSRLLVHYHSLKLAGILDLLRNPAAVGLNMRRGSIARPSLRTMLWLHSGEAIEVWDAIERLLRRNGESISRLAGEAAGRRSLAPDVAREIADDLAFLVGAIARIKD